MQEPDFNALKIIEWTRNYFNEKKVIVFTRWYYQHWDKDDENSWPTNCANKENNRKGKQNALSTYIQPIFET